MWAGTGGSKRMYERMRALSGTGGPRKDQSGTHDPMAQRASMGFVSALRSSGTRCRAVTQPCGKSIQAQYLPRGMHAWLLHRARSRAKETQTWAIDSEGMKGQTKDKESVYLLVGCRERPGPGSVPFKGGRRENSANYTVQGP